MPSTGDTMINQTPWSLPYVAYGQRFSQHISNFYWDEGDMLISSSGKRTLDRNFSEVTFVLRSKE